jgi:hypothetical protein
MRCPREVESTVPFAALEIYFREGGRRPVESVVDAADERRFIDGWDNRTTQKCCNFTPEAAAPWLAVAALETM